MGREEDGASTQQKRRVRPQTGPPETQRQKAACYHALSSHGKRLSYASPSPLCVAQLLSAHMEQWGPCRPQNKPAPAGRCNCCRDPKQQRCGEMPLGRCSASGVRRALEGSCLPCLLSTAAAAPDFRCRPARSCVTKGQTAGAAGSFLQVGLDWEKAGCGARRPFTKLFETWVVSSAWMLRQGRGRRARRFPPIREMPHPRPTSISVRWWRPGLGTLTAVQGMPCITSARETRTTVDR